jgi:hypothetical protein
MNGDCCSGPSGDGPSGDQFSDANTTPHQIYEAGTDVPSILRSPR